MKLVRIQSKDFTGCERGWMKYKRYKTARKKNHLYIAHACEWCGTMFNDDDDLAIGIAEKGRNLILCDSCGEALIKDSWEELKRGK